MNREDPIIKTMFEFIMFSLIVIILMGIISVIIMISQM